METTSTSTSSSISPSDLRRSKRRKFHLDVVAAVHGTAKKSKSDALSVDTEMTPEPTDDEDYGAGKRKRRSTAPLRNFGYIFHDDGDDDDRGFIGTNFCLKCPARYESKAGLNNHAKLHTGEKRKFCCELCDFSSSTIKASIQHGRLHKHFGVISAQTSPTIMMTSTATATSAVTASSILETEASKAPKLIAASEVPYAQIDSDSAYDEAPTMSPLPPILMPEIEMNENNEEIEATTTTHQTEKPKSKEKKMTKKEAAAEAAAAAAAAAEAAEAALLAASEKNEKKCPNCPFVGKSINRLKRHTKGHDLEKGYACAAKNCTFKCGTSGFLKRHYTLHKDERLPWPPIYVENGKELMRAIDDDEHENDKVASSSPKLKRRKEWLRKLAQIKSHRRTENEGEMRCNVGSCEFVTFCKSAFLLHKIRAHNVKMLRKKKSGGVIKNQMHICLKCGHRAKSFSDLRVHRLIKHQFSSALHRRRHERTFYLKEMLGESFFIGWHLNGKKHQHQQQQQQQQQQQRKEAAMNETTKEIKKEELDESFDSNYSNNSKEETYHCDLCPYKAVSASRVDRHRAKHFVEHEFKCKICNFSCRNQEVMTQHDRLHEEAQSMTAEAAATTNGNVDEPLETGGCSEEDEEDEEKAEFSIEMKVEENATPKVENGLVMKWCRKNISDRKLTDNFIRIVVDGQKMFECIECPYTSKYRGDIRTHKTRHNKTNEWRCIQCSYSAQRPVSLRDHLKQHVTTNGLQEMTKVKKLINHGTEIGCRKGYGKHRIYCCNQCQYVTSTIGCLWRHYRFHKKVPRVHVCSSCTYSSVDKMKMDEHIVIHMANGRLQSFVRRVNKEGRPIPMITDYSFDHATLGVSSSPASSTVSVDSTTTTTTTTTTLTATMTTGRSGGGATVGDDSVMKFSIKMPKSSSSRSLPQSVSPPSSSPSSSSQQQQQQSTNAAGGGAVLAAIPSRLLSERTTRNRGNYFSMVNTASRSTSRLSTPTTHHSSSPNLLLQVTSSAAAVPTTNDSDDQQNLERIETIEEIEESHFIIRQYLKIERGAEQSHRCPDCPFSESDITLFRLHRDMHFDNGKKRQFACCECNFSAYTAAALQSHLKLHSPIGFVSDHGNSSMLRKKTTPRRAEIIPPGAKFYQCTSCSYRTVHEQNFIDHRFDHRKQLAQRLATIMKRSTPKDDYQKPKMKFLGVNRSLKCCTKCFFRCTSQHQFVAHLDHHGWNRLYKCRMCDYSDSTKNTVDFHETHHHVSKDHTLTDLQANLNCMLKNEQQNEEIQKIEEELGECVKEVGNALKCTLCDYITHLAPELSFHLSTKHSDAPNAKEAASYLQMNMMPPKTVPSSC